LEETMKLLIALQACDLRIKEKLALKEKGPEAVRKREEDLAGAEALLQEEMSKLDAHDSLSRETEREIQDLDEGLKKAEVKLSAIASNKEYKAALKEIEGIKREKETLEISVIELLEQKDELVSVCDDNQKQTKELKQQFDQDKKQILKDMKALDRGLKKLEKERVRCCKATDQALLKKYDLLRDHKAGVAVTSVINGVCQACRMAIPPQKFNELIRGDKLMNCPTCARIIYWGEDERYMDNQGKS
jgi:predicted  nucleic acid-binding Zn-ribbon protein